MILSRLSLFLCCLFFIGMQQDAFCAKPSQRNNSSKQASSAKQGDKKADKKTQKKEEKKEEIQAEEEATPALLANTPQWEKGDQEQMLRGDLITGVGILPDESEEADAPEDLIPLDIPDAEIVETPIPVEIPQELMPLYLPSDKEQYLIDPQKLLSEQETADIARLLEEIREATEVSIFLTIFTSDQKIPASLNAPSLARQIFGDKPSCVLVEYRRGAFNTAQVIYSEDLSHTLTDGHRKSLLDAAKREAAESSEDLDVLWSFLNTVGTQLPGVINMAKTSPLAPKIAVPKSNYKIKSSPEDEKAPVKKPKLDEVAFSFWNEYGSGVLITLLVLFGTTGTILFIKKRKIYHIEHLPISKQLGAPHGTGSTRVLYYNTPKEPSKLEKDLLKDFFNS